jgi:AraC-like DNA-binding protein
MMFWAASTGGEWSNPLTVQISIRPPFWLTWWAKALYALLLGAFVAFSLTLYLKKKKAALVRENDSRVNRLFEMREKARHQFAASTNLYSKLRNMLGISPADFIRNVRLKRAAQLLTDNPTLSINEVSIRVGFSTPRNFSTQFKKMFGVLPSEYRGAENH